MPAGSRLRAFATYWRRRAASLVRSSFIAAIGTSALVAPACHAASEQSVQIDGVDAVIWTPDENTGHRLPVVVFSHGLYTCATQSRFITRAIADAGYFVVAPNHEDAVCGFSVGLFALSRLPGKPAMFWTDADYRDRADDIRALVAALPNDPRFSGQVDMARLALAGHSLGGYTVLGLAGAWPSWTLAGVKAVLAFAPYAMPFSRSEGFRHLAVPVMYQAGGFDPAFRRPVQRAYEESPFPKYYVEIDNAWHLAWTDVGGMHRHEIIAKAIAFLDMYVKNPSATVAPADASRVKAAVESSIN